MISVGVGDHDFLLFIAFFTSIETFDVIFDIKSHRNEHHTDTGDHKNHGKCMRYIREQEVQQYSRVD